MPPSSLRNSSCFLMERQTDAKTGAEDHLLKYVSPPPLIKNIIPKGITIAVQVSVKISDNAVIPGGGSFPKSNSL